MASGIVRAMPRVVIKGPTYTTLLAQQKSEITVPKIAFNTSAPNASEFGHLKLSIPVKCKIGKRGINKTILNNPTKPKK